MFDVFREYRSGALAGNDHCVTSVRVRSFPGSYFPGLGLNMEIRRYTKYLSLFSPNAGKYGPENLVIQTLLKQWSSSLLREILHEQQYDKMKSFVS